ncbi:hypothetical protein LIER_41670 [Lithospermum erythrorhizon]|uniref:Uncharacterized protein n=1 Tax=Lithospermum erythrorhizon TaxID=34254 RepID=A0AAV3RG71_LITER
MNRAGWMSPIARGLRPWSILVAQVHLFGNLHWCGPLWVSPVLFGSTLGTAHYLWYYHLPQDPPFFSDWILEYWWVFVFNGYQTDPYGLPCTCQGRFASLRHFTRFSTLPSLPATFQISFTSFHYRQWLEFEKAPPLFINPWGKHAFGSSQSTPSAKLPPKNLPFQLSQSSNPKRFSGYHGTH